MDLVINFAPVALAYIMFGVGISTNIHQFKEVFSTSNSLLVGLVLQTFLLPFAGYLAIIFFDIPLLFAR